jgi:hypothetical protein
MKYDFFIVDLNRTFQKCPPDCWTLDAISTVVNKAYKKTGFTSPDICEKNHFDRIHSSPSHFIDSLTMICNVK